MQSEVPLGGVCLDCLTLSHPLREVWGQKLTQPEEKTYELYWSGRIKRSFYWHPGGNRWGNRRNGEQNIAYCESAKLIVLIIKSCFIVKSGGALGWISDFQFHLTGKNNSCLTAHNTYTWCPRLAEWDIIITYQLHSGQSSENISVLI